MTLVFATRNEGKTGELRALFADTGIAVRSLAEIDSARARADPPLPALPEVIEDGDTFAANAIKKAVAISTATGMPALADDSGLEVDALSGAPGVYSARYAGESASDGDNNDKLLLALAGVSDDLRTARFRSVLAFADRAGPLGAGHIVTGGACEGRILRAPRGVGGFGYDPLFYSDELQATFAEVAVGDKNAISHRARAMTAMKPRLAAYFRLANMGDSG